MANMHLLSRLGAAPLAFKYLVTPTASLNWPSATCNLNKFHSCSKQHDVSYAKEVGSLCHLETTHVCRRLQLNSSFCQQESRKLTTQAYRQVSSTDKWKPKHLQNGALTEFMPVRHYAYKQIYPIPENLDPWKFPADDLGTTFPCYLSDRDVENIRVMANSGLEMFNTIFQSKSKKSISKKPIKDDSVFGVPLTVLRHDDITMEKGSPHLKMPSVLYLLLQYIHKNGLNSEDLFNSKIPNSAKVQELKKDIDANFYKNKNYEIGSDYNAHVVAAVLKDFLAELPKPLMSTPEFDFFIDLFETDIMLRHRLDGINLFILMMTPEHRDSLQMLLALLHALEKLNKVTLQQCAEIFAPLLFAVHPDYSEQEKIKKQKEFVDITRLLVHYNDFLFMVPSEILDGVRHINHFGHKPDKSWFPDLNFTLISPESKGRKPMVISPTTTAEEVVAFVTKDQLPMESYMKKLKCEVLGKKSTTSNFLCQNNFSCGGHIDERILDPKTKILPLFRINTTAEFSIKTWKGYNEELSVKVTGEINEVSSKKR